MDMEIAKLVLKIIVAIIAAGGALYFTFIRISHKHKLVQKKNVKVIQKHNTVSGDMAGGNINKN